MKTNLIKRTTIAIFLMLTLFLSLTLFGFKIKNNESNALLPPACEKIAELPLRNGIYSLRYNGYNYVVIISPNGNAITK